MGEIVGAAVVSHVPPLVLSEQVRRELNGGEDTSEEFTSIHSAKAWKDLDEWRIGFIAREPHTPREPCATQDKAMVYSKSSVKLLSDAYKVADGIIASGETPPEPNESSDGEPTP